MADRAHDGSRVRNESGRRRTTDAVRGSFGEADCMRVEQPGDANLYGVGPRSPGTVLSVRGWSLAAQLLRQHTRYDWRRQFQVSGTQPEHGQADWGSRRSLRHGARPPTIAETVVVVIRRVERVVSRAQRRRGQRPRERGPAPS